MQYHASGYAEDDWDIFWYEKNLQGDIVAVYSEAGTKLVSYTYDAWGNFNSTYHNGSSSSTIIGKNPFLYRGYYYDRDLKLYYLNARYYDPVVGRFISADYPDVVLSTPNALTDKNLFAYCDNNPVMRTDGDGQFWETAFDVISLVVSVAEVCATPGNPWAWVGLAGDVVDLIPFVCGVGEATDVIRIATNVENVVDAVDDVHDTAKAIDNVGEALDTSADFARKVDYYITPGGDAIPSSRKAFDENLSKLSNNNGKFYGEDSRGPVRIRVEQHNPTPNYSGPENPFHTSPHFHIDRKVNITTGKWKKTYTGLMEMFYD